MTITLPPDLENRLADEAHRLGTTPETLALDGLRKLFVVPPGEASGPQPMSLHDYLGGYVGAISGSVEPLSENCGHRFGECVAEKQEQGRL